MRATIKLKISVELFEGKSFIAGYTVDVKVEAWRL